MICDLWFVIGLINIERRVLGLITQKAVVTRPDRTQPLLSRQRLIIP